ncbi:maleylpyruvate isomerase N-terminal domain-containing protein [soil metagenome]
MDHSAFIDAIEAESARALEVLRSAEPGASVPTAPEWDVADLTWHLGEVQWFWGTIAADLLDDPEALEEPRRPDAGGLLDFLAAQTARLVDALRQHTPADRCWSWFDGGDSIGWVARRQSHEALIHRVDAELSAGIDVCEPDAALADDGVDEIVTVMMHLPEWGTFTPDRISVRLDAIDTGSVWTLVLGRFVGISPDSGTAYDTDAIRLVHDDGPAQTTATISGSAWELDRWLWGRLPSTGVQIEGDPGVAGRLRAAAQVD